MRVCWLCLGMLFAGCSGGGGVVCGATTCGADEVCCTDCGGNTSCEPLACAGGACVDAGTDSGSGSADAGPDPLPDSGLGDAGSDAGSDAGLDGGTCQPSECRLSPDGPCEAPTGPTGNGCCECMARACTSFCRCLAADTPIATPTGDVPVAELRVGDLVYSADASGVVLVPIARTNASPVTDHVVVRVSLASGATLFVSPMHPTADGRRFGELSVGDTLDDEPIIATELVPYEGSFTHDILPASESGTYYAGGVLVGSTLTPE